MSRRQHQIYIKSGDFMPLKEQIASIYDAIINLVSQAKNCSDGKSRVEFINSACNYVRLLEDDIDKSIPGDIPASLSQFYLLLIMRLDSVKLCSDESTCNSIIRSLEELKEVWLKL